MDKLAYLKPARLNWRNWLKASNSHRQHVYEDKFLTDNRKLPFAHQWSLMGHMHDLRVWTIAYAPSNRNNLRRMQEIHRLNAEMWYNVSEAIWRRIFVMIAFWFLVVKVFKGKYLN
jgi:hypothetical protein